MESNDGILGLAPSTREGFKSYLEVLKGLGYIDSNSFSYTYDKLTPILNLGNFDTSARSVSFEKLPTKGGDVIYGSRIVNYKFNS